ncbi:aminofutalosine deaminase family hydrolase [Malaciobacter mytili]|uniref:Chlorohydrolase n=1 Tax=Malaciobacter mytili LMG 24559 TaxID=1032238 RepID=A0AAX2AIX6_9BACT|nr:metal-dependent hydrolase [Malaciobacter mytili]AXH14200.1 metallo-dependent hydrolase, subgroup D [Malaciobacter mytili LMG 24559]RXI48736.1 chlorohydrolase [Malaciobacter mytili]RXK16272.1 chlorohydrolase [Malaciobacter mytili LMG 24559]
MKILAAKWVFTCDENSGIIEDGAIVYNKQIIDVDTLENIQKNYPSVEIERLEENSVLMPGLINSHVHLEFSSNSTTLKYGNFMLWLNSVIASRDELVQKANNKLISKKLEKMKKSGTTTIGAISSYGFDMQACLQTPINVVYFNEVIGSKADMIDALFADFKARLENSIKNQNESFFPAIAIHSPYSVHPVLIKESLKLAKEKNLAVSSHFLESPEEFDWLHKDEGGFLEFFKNFLGQEKAVTKPMEFLNQFEGLKNLSFTHCVEASDNDLAKIKQLDATINHCVTSNRVLNNTKLDLEKLKGINFAIGTDGLSSNNSLSMFDELRNVLMMHVDFEINSFASKVLKAATINGAKALGLNKGELKKQKDADIIAITLPDKIKAKEDLATHIILHTKYVKRTIIGGKDV